MTHQPDIEHYNLKPGDWNFTNLGDESKTWIWFGCPCGDGELAGIPVKKGSHHSQEKAWGWNGDEEKPTLTPSIQRMGGCNWHGYLTNGEFKSC